MSPNEGMFILHGLSSHNPTAIQTKLSLLNSRMHGLEPMQSLFDRW
jgi:hypothetical protein